MGSLTLESRPRTALPDTPPELVSPTATSFSSRSSPSVEHVWASHALASLPMSNYDKTSSRDDTYERRGSTPPAGPNNSTKRTPLPSLSSLFGPASSMRPLNASLPSRPAPFPMHSPLDRPSASNIGSPCPSSYFPSPKAQPRTTHNSACMVRSVSGSGSSVVAESRRQSETEPKWTQQDGARQEYTLGSKDNRRPSYASSSDVVMDYKENTTSSTPRDANGSGSENTTSPDTIGPKIWTGTHFLPRYMRTAEVPGEGMCYFYDDGTHCKTVIDGEAVNAHWGVTKAGKPRKRLAIACVTCREKKIKCDPDYPRCVQCDKFGRVCKFKNAPRGGQATSPSAQAAELHTGKTICSKPGSRGSRSPAMQAATHLAAEDSHHKRVKICAESYSPARNHSMSGSEARDHSKSPLPSQARVPEMSRISDEILYRAWQTDVYLSDPPSIMSVIREFFVHIDSTMLLKFLPEATWKAHVSASNQRKLPEDLMLLYSVLAIGILLSGGAKSIAAEYAQVAHYAQKTLGFHCLQLAQSQILLAAYFISLDRIHDATELLSSAASVADSLQLNVELSKSREANITTYPLGMNRDSYKESRRRTMWSLFMLERFNGMFPNRSALINPEDLYIRLPTDDESFEAQRERDEPLFDPYVLTASAPKGSQNVLANVVEMTHLWAECQVSLYRIACRPATASAESTRIQALAKKIRSWHSSLPENLSFSMNHLESAVHSGNAGSFLSLHILYHHAMIKVNRHHAAATQLGVQLQRSYTYNCFGHATSIVDSIYTFGTLRRGKSSLSMLPHITATAAVEAVDSLTASGTLSGIFDQIKSAKEAHAAVDTMSHMWEDVYGARAAITKRLDELIYIHEQGPRPRNPSRGYRLRETGNETHWHICEPIDARLPREMDIIYSFPL